MAMAKVWATVFSWGLKGCLDQPILLSQATMGFRIIKPISPASSDVTQVSTTRSGSPFTSGLSSAGSTQTRIHR